MENLLNFLMLNKRLFRIMISVIASENVKTCSYKEVVVQKIEI
jgi:hypothetical protein